MNISLTSDDSIRGIITVAIEKKDYEKDVDKNLRLYRRKMTLPGFRKGTAPMGMIRKVYGRRVMADEINRLTTENLFKYIRDNRLGIMGEPLPKADQEPINFDTQEEFKIQFDVALAPKMDFTLTKDDHLKWYDIRVDDTLVDKQIDAYRQDQGTTETPETVEREDWLRGKLVEMENGEQKPGGVWVEESVLFLNIIKDEDVLAKFIGAKVGDQIIFNPKNSYGNTPRALASLLNMNQEMAEQFTNDCRYEITHISRLKPAELDQQLFDRILGPNKVTDEAAFRDEIRKLMKDPLDQRSEVSFEHDLRTLLIQKVGDTPLADDILKRWLLMTSDKATPEDLDRDYPHIVEDMKYHVAREHFMAENELKVEDTDIEAMAKLVARSQFVQYGMFSTPDEMLDRFAKDLLKEETTRRNLINRASDRKFAEWAKKQVTIDTTEVSPEEYEKILMSESSNNNEAVKDEEK